MLADWQYGGIVSPIHFYYSFVHRIFSANDGLDPVLEDQESVSQTKALRNPFLISQNGIGKCFPLSILCIKYSANAQSHNKSVRSYYECSKYSCTGPR